MESHYCQYSFFFGNFHSLRETSKGQNAFLKTDCNRFKALEMFKRNTVMSYLERGKKSITFYFKGFSGLK